MNKKFWTSGVVPLIPLIVGAVILVSAVASFIYNQQSRVYRARAVCTPEGTSCLIGFTTCCTGYCNPSSSVCTAPPCVPVGRLCLTVGTPCCSGSTCNPSSNICTAPPAPTSTPRPPAPTNTPPPGGGGGGGGGGSTSCAYHCSGNICVPGGNSPPDTCITDCAVCGGGGGPPPPPPPPGGSCSGITYTLNPPSPESPNATVAVNINRTGATSCSGSWDNVGLKLDGVNQGIGLCYTDGSNCSLGYHSFINSGAAGTRTLQFTVNNGSCLCNTSTFCTRPIAPGGFSPSGNTTCGLTSVTLTWNTVSGISTYALRVNDHSDGWTGTCSSVNPGDTCIDNVNAASYTRTVVPGRSYNWWVHSVGSCGWSPAAGATFTVPTCVTTLTPTNTPPPPGVTIPPTTPIPPSCVAINPPPFNTLDPITDFVAGQVNIRWGSVSGAALYALRIDDKQDDWPPTRAGASNTCADVAQAQAAGTNLKDVCINNLTTTTYSYEFLANHIYDWWIHALNSCGQYSGRMGPAGIRAIAPTPTLTPTPDPNITAIPNLTLTPTPSGSPAPSPTPTSPPPVTPSLPPDQRCSLGSETYQKDQSYCDEAHNIVKTCKGNDVWQDVPDACRSKNCVNDPGGHTYSCVAKCVPLLEKHGKKLKIAILPENYTSYSEFINVALDAIYQIKKTNLGSLINKMNFYLVTDFNQSYHSSPYKPYEGIDFQKIHDTGASVCGANSSIVIDNPTNCGSVPGGMAAPGLSGYACGSGYIIVPHELGHAIVLLNDEKVGANSPQSIMSQPGNYIFNPAALETWRIFLQNYQ